ncbi:MAG: diversity-generating retroelement protein Avd [Patescibacteria group bacterium]
MFHKTYELYKLLYQNLKSFPKKDKYTLGQKIDNTALEILEAITLAGISSQNKLNLLEKASQKLDLLKILIRLADDLKILDNKKYLEIQQKIQEIGKMLGGWIKSRARE